MTKWLFFIFLWFFTIDALSYKDSMQEDLRVIKHLFEVSYAPAEWKKEYLGWDLEIAYENAKNEISSTPDLTLKQYQQILKKFLATTQDYHVSIQFYSTENATLPFEVKTVNNRTFIDWYDKSKMQKNAINIGDELIEFDGNPIDEVLKEIKMNNRLGTNPYTDQGLADNYLTHRSGVRGDNVPSGTVLIALRSCKDAKLNVFNIEWIYQPELIEVPSAMFRTEQENLQRKNLGSRYSFVPKLGKVKWRWKDKPIKRGILKDSWNFYINQKEENKPFWNAYIYKNKDGRQIGYIRIPAYRYDGSYELEEKIILSSFAKIISYMQKSTEALVIDQVNNPGGSLDLTYSLASMLTNSPLSAIKNRIKITQEDVYDAVEKLKNNGAMEEKEILYNNAIIQEWNEGRTLTNPLFVGGIDIIEPNKRTNYTKPILFLINELSISCGDIMPAILQDNHRAVIFGNQTAGAGGGVRQHTFPNQNGIRSINYTCTLGERTNFQKIENQGIKPDIEYKIGINDIKNQYADYGKAVNEAISKMLPAKPKPKKKRLSF
ncbi:MAG: PDZ domain-containing protein [Candidatus Protochlamydia sp.]|nr:PDZ domain-containing protein [Candidatus Protochlamydia sp.]